MATNWDNLLDRLKQVFAPALFEENFSKMKLLESNDARLLIEVPHAQDIKQLKHAYKGLMEITYAQLTGKQLEFDFRHPQHVPQDLPQRNINTINTVKPSLLQEQFTFDSFVVGGKSQFAYSAASAVGESPGGTQFNPLLIYGGSGLGKTHLLQAIGNYALDGNPNIRVHYVTAEDFTNDFISAIQNKQIAKFSNFYRTEVDLLLIDDIQFLDTKVETQNEFFHIFNTLHQEGKQIVLTSDTAPVDMKGLEERLISRFQWGLSVDVQPPDMETREAILRKKAISNNLDLNDNVIVYLATHVEGNVRLLEGAIRKLILYSTMQKQDITMKMTEQVVAELVPTLKKKINQDEILNLVTEHFGVSEDSILESGRGPKEVAHARQIAMYLMKEMTNHSLKSVGNRFGNRDHSTVQHAVKTIKKQMEEDSSFQKLMESFKARL
jgi:chromosomal replication initiator protein